MSTAAAYEGTALARVSQALLAAGCKRQGKDWTCPCHDDKRPSLGVWQGSKGVVMKCAAGCRNEDILAAIGLMMSDLFDEPPKHQNGDGARQKRSVVERYSYVDERGRELFQVTRWSDKSFTQSHRDPSHPEARSNGWVPNIQGVRRVLYRLPQVRKAITAGKAVYIAEGEKDVHAIEGAGGVATTNPMGAGAWLEEYAGYLRDANVVVVADKDEAGRKHAATIAASLAGVATSVVVVEAAEGKDPHDHLAAGRALDEFVPVDELGEELPPPEVPDGGRDAEVPTEVMSAWAPRSLLSVTSEPPSPPTILEASNCEASLFYPGRRHLVSGPPDAGKTWVAAISAVAELARGGHVVWIDSDGMGAGPLLECLRALGVDDQVLDERFHWIPADEPPTDADDAALAALRDELVGDRAPVLLVVDSFDPTIRLLGGNPDKTAEVDAAVVRIVNPWHRVGATSVVLDHVKKGKEGRGGWAIGSQRKVGFCDVHIQIEPGKQKFTRTQAGTIYLYVHKDRPGWHVRGQSGLIGSIAMTPQAGRMTWDLSLHRGGEAREDDRAESRFRPTVLMERASRYVEVQGRSSRNAIVTSVTGKESAVGQAIDCLVVEGYFTEETDLRADGHAKGRWYESSRPYRHAEDPLDEHGKPRESQGSAPPPNLRPTSARAEATPTLRPSARPPLHRGRRAEAEADLEEHPERAEVRPADEALQADDLDRWNEMAIEGGRGQ